MEQLAREYVDTESTPKNPNYNAILVSNVGNMMHKAAPLEAFCLNKRMTQIKESYAVGLGAVQFLCKLVEIACQIESMVMYF
jgi:hypothetical protein